MGAPHAAELLVANVLPYMYSTNTKDSSSTTEQMVSDTSDTQLSLGEEVNPEHITCNSYSYIILTLKFFKKAKLKHIDSYFQKAKSVLCREYICWDFKCIHLNANSLNERTLVCKMGGRHHS